MRIKLIAKHEDYKVGTILEADDATAKELIDGKVAVEAKKLEEEIDAEVKSKAQAEEAKMEVKDAKGEIVDKGSNAPVWKSTGEFLKAVKARSMGMGSDPRLQKASTGLGEDNTGASLVQHPIFQDQIFRNAMQASKVASKCRTFIAGDHANGMRFMRGKETARTSTWYGGIAWNLFAEGGSINLAPPQFDQLDVSIEQVGAVVPITEALLEDVQGADTYIAELVGRSLGQMYDKEVLFGTLGAAAAVIGDNATVKIPLAGQYPTAEEYSKMYVSLQPRYLDNAEWFMTGAEYGALLQTVSPVSGYPIYTRDLSEPAKIRLFGRPVNVVEQMGDR